jgi:hypothetical protein
MKITKRQLRRIIKEEIINEGWFDQLGKKALRGISKFVRPNEIMDDMSVADAKEELDRAVVQFAISYAVGIGEKGSTEGILAGVEKAKQHVNDEEYQMQGQP